ncbi:TPA: hypothetical protein N0F65_008874 [Lagenidium giganteum]|uniref:Uncharacterized protein n=1 Tax=Lagenidium giganteum TaxID=4803 RepID=A0AAV2YYN0_9STRA|nr:TPA: hypothetical protein N0F65_008874 [Lagenidium giganteum]
MSRPVANLLLIRQATIRFVRDSVTSAVDAQKEQADKQERRNTNEFKINENVYYQLKTYRYQPSVIWEQTSFCRALSVPSPWLLAVGMRTHYASHRVCVCIPPSTSADSSHICRRILIRITLSHDTSVVGPHSRSAGRDTSSSPATQSEPSSLSQPHHFVF